MLVKLKHKKKPFQGTTGNTGLLENIFCMESFEVVVLLADVEQARRHQQTAQQTLLAQLGSMLEMTEDLQRNLDCLMGDPNGKFCVDAHLSCQQGWWSTTQRLRKLLKSRPRRC